MPETRVKRFEGWTGTEEAAESVLFKDYAVADRHARQKPVDRLQHQGEAHAGPAREQAFRLFDCWLEASLLDQPVSASE